MFTSWQLLHCVKSAPLDLLKSSDHLHFMFTKNNFTNLNLGTQVIVNLTLSGDKSLHSGLH